MKTALAIAAHPDDIEFLMSGTLMLLRKAGYEMAVTTRKGLIYPAHREHLTALPRVSLNGSFQNLRYLEVLLSGTAFTLFNGFRRVA